MFGLPFSKKKTKQSGVVVWTADDQSGDLVLKCSRCGQTVSSMSEKRMHEAGHLQTPVSQTQSNLPKRLQS
jgi:hypothetical protein